MSKKAAATVLREYPSQYQARTLRPLDNAGGLSGSQLWRFKAPAGEFCLRRWPQEASHSRVLTMHMVLQHVRTRGFTLVPVPVANQLGQTVTMFDDYLWELTPWMTGEPLLSTDPRESRLADAMERLAQFHHAASTYQPVSEGSSPGVAERLEQLLDWRSHQLDVARQCIAARGLKDLQPRAQVAFQLFKLSSNLVEQELRQAAALSVPLQFCIRDVRAEHVLFSDDHVTAIIDFGAMRVESVAGDIARLLATTGSVANRPDLALAAYEQHRPLHEAERQLIPVFYRSGIVLGTMNWMQWLGIEGREFGNWPNVLARIDRLLKQWTGEFQAL